MSATTPQPLRKPRRKWPKKPYNPNQSVASALVAREKLELLRLVARHTNRTLSDVIRESLDAQLPELLIEVERALAQAAHHGAEVNPTKEGGGCNDPP
jgi:hypothetical protein